MLQASEQGAESELAILGLGSVRGRASPGGTVVGDTWRPRRVANRRWGGDYSWGAKGRGSRKRVSLGQATRREMGGFWLLWHLQHSVELLLTVCQSGPEQL
jgi:hypothetical protein